MRVLEDICNGRHSPVLPVRVTDEHGGQIESRSRFAFIRMYNRENETYNFLKRNVQFSLFFHPIKAKAFNHHLSGN